MLARPLLILAFLLFRTPAFAQQRPPSPISYHQPVIALTHVAIVDGTGARRGGAGADRDGVQGDRL